MMLSRAEALAILGVAPSATGEEIKRAFRRLAMKWHPDRIRGAEKEVKQAEESYLRIRAAYDCLKQAKDRQDDGAQGGRGASYKWEDDGGEERADGHRNAAGAGWAAEDGIDGVGVVVEHQIGVTVACRGGTERIKVKVPQACRRCSGTGYGQNEECKKCGGAGYSTYGVWCRACQGTGVVMSPPCRSCGGTGLRERLRRLVVQVPGEVVEGSVLRLKGAGGDGRMGGKPGDLQIRLRVVEDGKYRVVNGVDIEGQVELDYLEALMGCTKTVDTPWGPCEISVPEMIDGSRGLRLRGFGLRDGRRRTEGDLILRTSAKAPNLGRALSEAERALLASLRQCFRSGRTD